MAGERPLGAARPDLLLEIHISPLGVFATVAVSYWLRAKASCTVVGTGIHACGDPQTGREFPVLGRRSRKSVVRYGCQTIVAQPIVVYSLENRVIRHGNQTSRSAHTLTSKLENRMIRLGCHTGRCSCRLPRRSHAQGPDRPHGASCRPFRAVARSAPIGVP